MRKDGVTLKEWTGAIRKATLDHGHLRNQVLKTFKKFDDCSDTKEIEAWFDRVEDAWVEVVVMGPKVEV